ncbi:MAG: hypothetical protein IJG13_12085 [Kiritimatiellae bacterium]|nr:hypothetical protein [Kiritimatiellia bacterium]
MALLTSHSSANLVIDSGLVVTYSKSLINGNWSYTSANVSGYYDYMWEIHRRARMSFRYVGMTKDAAESCKAAMIAAYTRAFKISIWDYSSMGGAWYDNSAGEMPMAEIAMSHNEDGSYDVVVNVNEDDTRMRKTSESTNYTLLFSAERSRTYEGGETEVAATPGGSD